MEEKNNIKPPKILIITKNNQEANFYKDALNTIGFNTIKIVNYANIDIENQNKFLEFVAQEKPNIIINTYCYTSTNTNTDISNQEIAKNKLLIKNLLKAASIYNIDKLIFIGNINNTEFLIEDYNDTLSQNAVYLFSNNRIINNTQTKKSVYTIKKNIQNDFACLITCPVYGALDTFFNQKNLICNLISDFHKAKLQHQRPVILPGTGTSRVEFIHIKDLAKALAIVVTKNLKHQIYHVGFGYNISSSKLAKTVQKIVGHTGTIFWDDSKPDPKTLASVNNSKIKSLGWEPEVSLEEGIESTYNWFLKNQ